MYKQNNPTAGLTAVDKALTCLQKDRITKPLKFDKEGIPKCLLLRSRLMIMAKEPNFALEDIKQGDY